jgi:hypothetical protein
MNGFQGGIFLERDGLWGGIVFEGCMAFVEE